MRKINALFNTSQRQDNSLLAQLTKDLQAHQLLQQLWLQVVPSILGKSSFASNLINGQLNILADSAIVANKIKLTQASLLTQLKNLQNCTQTFRECKVTAIVVKVQVKSRPKPIIKTPRKLSNTASKHLKKLAEQLGDCPLADNLNVLASKNQ